MGSENCRTVSEIFLHIFNFIVLAFGIVILSISAYLVANLEGEFSEIGLSNPIIASLVVGCFFVLFAILGIIGTCTDNSCLLIIYILGVLCLALATIASGIVLLVYTDTFDNVQDGQPKNRAEERILDFELAMFQECCATQPGVVGIVSCDGVPNVQIICFNDQERFDSFRNLFDQDTCDVLSRNVEVDGKPLVGTILDGEGACGNGIAFVFVNDANQYISDNLTKLGAANIVAGVVILLLLIAACVVLWTKENEKKQQKAKQNKVGCF